MDLINLRGVLIIHSCFCFTLRTMFISSLGGEFKNSLHVLFILYFISFVSHMSEFDALLASRRLF